MSWRGRRIERMASMRRALPREHGQAARGTHEGCVRKEFQFDLDRVCRRRADDGSRTGKNAGSSPTTRSGDRPGTAGSPRSTGQGIALLLVGSHRPVAHHAPQAKPPHQQFPSPRRLDLLEKPGRFTGADNRLSGERGWGDGRMEIASTSN